MRKTKIDNIYPHVIINIYNIILPHCTLLHLQVCRVSSSFALFPACLSIITFLFHPIFSSQLSSGFPYITSTSPSFELQPICPLLTHCMLPSFLTCFILSFCQFHLHSELSPFLSFLHNILFHNHLSSPSLSLSSLQVMNNFWVTSVLPLQVTHSHAETLPEIPSLYECGLQTSQFFSFSFSHLFPVNISIISCCQSKCLSKQSKSHIYAASQTT